MYRHRQPVGKVVVFSEEDSIIFQAKFANEIPGLRANLLNHIIVFCFVNTQAYKLV